MSIRKSKKYAVTYKALDVGKWTISTDVQSKLGMGKLGWIIYLHILLINVTSFTCISWVPF